MDSEYSLIRIFDTSAEWVIYHINGLPTQDKYLRFGSAVDENRIRRYVEDCFTCETTRTNADVWYAIKHDSEIVATLHVAIRGDLAEFAFTTSPDHRNKGLGQMLFARGFQLVTEFSITKIYMFMLSQNSPMKHIAKKFGLAVVTEGPEAECSIQISYPVPLNRVAEVKYQMIDKGMWNHG